MNLLAEPAPSFDTPIELLRACHERILQHCRLLDWLDAQLQTQAVDPQMQQAAARIHRYFTLSGPPHHADEELQLFPWLLTHKDLPENTRTAILELREQHASLDACWALLAEQLCQIRDGHFSDSSLRKQDFVDLSRQHVQRENDQIFSVASQLLDQETAQVLGAKMVERRRAHP